MKKIALLAFCVLIAFAACTKKEAATDVAPVDATAVTADVDATAVDATAVPAEAATAAN